MKKKKEIVKFYFESCSYYFTTDDKGMADVWLLGGAFRRILMDRIFFMGISWHCESCGTRRI
jgi:hypothetical protein